MAAGVLIALCSSLAGCGSGKDLSRGVAKEVINRHDAFAQVKYEQVFLGYDFRNSRTVVDGFHSAGYLVRSGFFGNDLGLTEAGEAACKNTPRDPNIPNLRSFAVGKRKFVAVTGIADFPGTGMKEVKFTWRWLPTELGEQLRAGNQTINSRYDPEQLREGVALCRRYDDGWRIEEIKGI